MNFYLHVDTWLEKKMKIRIILISKITWLHNISNLNISFYLPIKP